MTGGCGDEAGKTVFGAWVLGGIGSVGARHGVVEVTAGAGEVGGGLGRIECEIARLAVTTMRSARSSPVKSPALSASSRGLT